MQGSLNDVCKAMDRSHDMYEPSLMEMAILLLQYDADRSASTCVNTWEMPSVRRC